MENASKALIIAGAILISIVLIAIGVLIVNNIQGTVDETVTQMSAQEIQIFNSKFNVYEGKQTPGNVKGLLSIIATNNLQDTTPTVKVTYGTIKDEADVNKIQGKDIRGAVSTSSNYTVSFTLNSRGQIDTVIIEPYTK